MMLSNFSSLSDYSLTTWRPRLHCLTDVGWSVCPLMPSRNTYHLTWVSLALDVGYLFTAAPAKRSRCSLPWTRVISSRPPLLILNSALLHQAQQLLLGGGDAPLGRCPWPPACGSSSRPLPLTSGVGELLLGKAPDLGCVVAPLRCHPWPGRGEAPLRRSYAVAAWCSGSPPLTLGEG